MATMQARAVSRPSRASSVVVRAQQPSVDRRAVFGMLAAAVGAAMAMPLEASATKIPFQESIGGMGTGGGSMTKSPTTASSEGYTLEGYPGTRKPSFIEPKKKKKLMAKARANGEAASKK